MHHAKHLPYLSDEDLQAIGDDKTAQMVSTARCARVSYYKHDGTKPTIEEDLALATRLKKSRHMSPFEHTATDENNPETFFANLRCWRSFRYDIEREMG